MLRRVRSALRLPWRDWLILFQAWLLLFFVDVALRILPFVKVQSILERPAQDFGDQARPELMPTMLRLHRLVDCAARYHLYQMSCLRQALVLQWLLRKRNIFADLRFGVRKDAGGLQAHAWLEYAGCPIGDVQAQMDVFAPLVAIEEA